MKYIYVLLILLVLFVLVYLITEDRCQIEHFKQIEHDGNKRCNDSNALNTDLDNEKIIDNSYCIYDYDTVCSRPFANNYDNSLDDININNTSSSLPVCGNPDFGNYVDVYTYNDNGEKVRAVVTDATGDPLSYLGNGVEIDPRDTNQQLLIYKSDGSPVYLQTNVIDNSKCKKINNKICRFPMADLDVNSLQGISKNDVEFKSLVNVNNELLPDQYITTGPMYSQEESKIRSNKLALYKELFFDKENIGSFLNYGLNLWDVNGFVTVDQLTMYRDNAIYKNITARHPTQDLDGKILGSYINEEGTINNRYGYVTNPNLFTDQKVPGNYHALYDFANAQGWHTALAVSKNGDKYACGIGKTKAIACDVALARCKSFIPLTGDNNHNLEKYFEGKATELRTELKRRRNVCPDPEQDSFWNMDASVSGTKIIDTNIDKERQLQEIIFNYIDNLQELTLAASYYKMISLKELYSRIIPDDTEARRSEMENIVSLVEGSGSATTGPSLNEILSYIMYKSKQDELKGNICGILMVDNERYLNFNNDATFIDENSSCNPLPTFVNLCNDNNCNEAAVIGVNKNNQCFLIQDVSTKFKDWDQYNNEPEESGTYPDGSGNWDYSNDSTYYNNLVSQWNDEKGQILENDKINLGKNLMKRCNTIGDNCMLYRLNGEVYSYNSLFN